MLFMGLIAAVIAIAVTTASACHLRADVEHQGPHRDGSILCPCMPIRVALQERVVYAR